MESVRIGTLDNKARLNLAIKQFIESQGMSSGINEVGKRQTPLANMMPKIANWLIRNDFMGKEEKTEFLAQMKDVFKSDKFRAFDRFLTTAAGNVFGRMISPIAIPFFQKLKGKLKKDGET